MRRERTNLFPCRKTQFCDTLKPGSCPVLLYVFDVLQRRFFALCGVHGLVGTVQKFFFCAV